MTDCKFRGWINTVRKSLVLEMSPMKRDQGTISEVLFYDRNSGPNRVSYKCKDHQFFIDIVAADGHMYRYGFSELFTERSYLCSKPYKMTLEEYLAKTPLNRRRHQLYNSPELYPNKYVKGIIQGLLTAFVENYGKSSTHGYLQHPRNILLHDSVYPPYPSSYLFLPKLKTQADKLIHDANEHKQYLVPVSFVHSICETYMEDVSALYDVIFNQILEIKHFPLPPDWKEFEKAFAKKDVKLFYEKLASHSILWGWHKQLELFVYAYHLLSSSTPDMRTTIMKSMQNLEVVYENWCVRVAAEKPWDKVFTFDEDSDYVTGRPEDLIKFFRHLVTHVDITQLASNTKAQLAFRISRLFPRLLSRMSEILVESGIKF